MFLWRLLVESDIDLVACTRVFGPHYFPNWRTESIIYYFQSRFHFLKDLMFLLSHFRSLFFFSRKLRTEAFPS